MTKWEDRTPIERLQVAASGSYYHEEIQWGIDRIAELETQLAAVRAVGFNTHPSWNCGDEFDKGWNACRKQVEEALAGGKDDG